MNYWSYKAGEYARAARGWFGENARIVGMGAALALVALVYVVFFLESPFKSREMVILQRPRPDWGTVVFSLDDDYRVRTIEVVALSPEGDTEETLWKIRKGRDTPDLSAFAYGQPLRGMEADIPARPLEAGREYRLVVRASGARGETDFTFAGGDSRNAPRSRRGG